jgi:hypothetical protein
LEDNIITSLGDIRWEVVNWMHLTQVHEVCKSVTAIGTIIKYESHFGGMFECSIVRSKFADYQEHPTKIHVRMSM